MRTTSTLILASTNRHKLEEFRSLIKNFPQFYVDIEPASKFVRNASKLGLVESYDSYLENASAKARTINQGTHYPVIADDSGLEVDMLDRRPGVKSHRFSTPKAGQSQDAANIEKVLSELRGVPMDKRTASFNCVIALVVEGVLVAGVGQVKGRILEAPQGEGGFGYDPIFMPDGFKKSFAEMTEDEKNSISHRADALKDLTVNVEKYGIVLARP